MRVLSLFSGVGGFDMGLEAAGMTTVFQCEIDNNARAVLDYHWRDVPKWDDVSTLTGKHILEMTGGVDVVAWGSPCQDLSIAGRRAGLSGERSGLFREGIRIIKELLEVSNGTCPTWSVWENVYGALSSNGGADFGEVLYEMDEAGACFSEWAVLDAQYFGVPQRRRRVFVLSCFDSATAAGCPDPILPVARGLSRGVAAGKDKRKETAGAIADGVGSGSGTLNEVIVRNKDLNISESATNNVLFESFQFANWRESDVVGTLRTNDMANIVVRENENDRVTSSVVGSLQARDYKGVGNQLVDEHKLIIEASSFDELNLSDDPRVHHTLRARGADGTGVLDSSMIIRRLTPVECERLMGWPDNHTKMSANGEIANSHRYKMCGNGVASPVAQWIGEQIVKVGTH